MTQAQVSVHSDNIFRSMKDMTFETTISHQCGVTMSDSVDARAIAELMATKPGIVVTYMPAMIRIDGDPKIEFMMDEISEALGRPMTPHWCEIVVSNFMSFIERKMLSEWTLTCACVMAIFLIR